MMHVNFVKSTWFEGQIREAAHKGMQDTAKKWFEQAGPKGLLKTQRKSL